MKYFNASDPRHARINRLRTRCDKPHLWFENGSWRVSPLPIQRRRMGAKTLWLRAHTAAHIANFKLVAP